MRATANAPTVAEEAASGVSDELRPRPGATLVGVSDSLVEACCLAAVVAIPLYFSFLTSTGFEPDKAFLLRVLALIAGTAWLLGTAGRGFQFRSLSPLNLILALGVLLFAIYALATVLSIDPRLSFWGSHDRQEGLVTRAGYLVFFVCAATRLRGAEQIHRLLTVLIFGSLPACVYGFLQQTGWNPLPVIGDPSSLQWPVRSTLGQHVFFGSYLVLVIPFTLARLVETWRSPPDHVPMRPALRSLSAAGVIGIVVLLFVGFIGLGTGQLPLYALLPGILTAFVLAALLSGSPLSGSVFARHARLIGYGSLLVLQLLILGFTSGRGAWLGCFASLPVFGLLAAVRLGQMKIAAAIVGAAMAATLALALLNIPNGPLQPVRTLPGMARLANITESGGAGGSSQGRILIWQGVGKLMTKTPPIGGSSGGRSRDVLGYGPESMNWAFQAVFPVKLRRATSELYIWDRAHNVFLDNLVDAGVLALLAFCALLVAVFWKVLTFLRMVNEVSAWMLIAIGSALAGHLIDGLFGLETPATLLILWLMIGLAAGLPWFEKRQQVKSERQEAAALMPLGALVILLLSGAVYLVATPTPLDHPGILAAITVLSALAGVAMLSMAIMPVRGSAKATVAPSLASLGAAIGVAILAILGLASQLRFETAAIAEGASANRTAPGYLVDRLRYLQEGSQNQVYQPFYDTQLAFQYLNLATRGGLPVRSALGGLHPDPRTLDPEIIPALAPADLLSLGRESLLSARNLSPLDPEVYSNLGTIYLESGNPGRAYAEFHKAEALSVDNPKYLDQEALAHLQAGHAAVATALAGKANAIDGGFWFTYYTRALISQSEGDTATAREEASIALYNAHLAWPRPPPQQTDQLLRIERGQG